VTPSLTTSDVLLSLASYIVVYAVIYAFGLYYIYRLLRDGPAQDVSDQTNMTPARPLAIAVQATKEAPQ
jgi:cytochrome d ubiquinol oxidase subunit I